MGFELNRIMKQYGVNTPGLVNYSGAAAPVAPTAPTISSLSTTRPAGLITGMAYDMLAGADKTSADQYNKDLAAYNTTRADLMSKYDVDQKAYDDYKTNYQNRVQNTPMYAQSQFDTGYGTTPSTAGTGSQANTIANLPGGIGIDQQNRNVKNWFAENPGADTAAIRAAQAKYGVNDADIRNAMGSDFNFASGPIGYGSTYMRYAAAPGGIGTNQVSQKIRDWFAKHPNATDAEIKAAQAAEGISGKDIYNATGSYFGNQLAAPTYGTTPVLAPGTTTAVVPVTQPVTQPVTTNTNTATTTGPDLTSAAVKAGIASGTLDAQGNPYDNYYVMAKGGPVKTHYQTAGEVRLPSGYASAEDEADFARRFHTPSSDVMTSPVNVELPQAQMMTAMPPAQMMSELPAPRSVLTQIAQPVAAEPVASYSNEHLRTPMELAPQMAAPARQMAPAGAVPFGNERMGNIQALFAAYGPKDSAYSEDLKTARASAKAESDAFANMLKTAMSSPENEQSSKAEMYFRLASAFGSPTKTGQFSENLGMVGKELGEMAKSKRTDAQQKLALMLEGQKMKMTAAKEDLNTLRALTGEEMKDKRTIATELIKDYIKSGEPQSAAGKQALDEGLKAGTPAYQKRVTQIGDANIEGKMGAINAQLAGISMAQANFALNQMKFTNQQKEQAKLSPTEVKLKTGTEDIVAQTDQALLDLKKAYTLNPNTFDNSVIDMAQRKALEAGGSKDAKTINTRELENLLQKASLSQLKSTFPGSISNDERKALNDVQGLGAKSIEERAAIMKNAYTALKSANERNRKRLVDINQGVYRNTSSIEEGTD